MLPIGQWVLRESARCAKRWHAANDRRAPLTVAVNLSNMQFRAPGFVESVERVLAEEKLPGEWLEIELTERMLMDDLPEVRRALGRLRSAGIRISIDDFGTGYSSLGHLRDLPIDKLKIDRSFVRDLPEDRGAAAIAKAIVTMAQALHLTVIAEGVETDAQRAFLAELGCDELQGDAVGAVQSAEGIERRVAAEPGRRNTEIGAPPTSRRQLLLRFLRPLPAGHRNLPRARDGELARRCVLADGRAAADGGAGADRHRRHQHAVAADAGVVADDGAVLVGAVVVGGDAAGAVR